MLIAWVLSLVIILPNGKVTIETFPDLMTTQTACVNSSEVARESVENVLSERVGEGNFKVFVNCSPVKVDK